jgi:phosphoglycolate phosphatase
VTLSNIKLVVFDLDGTLLDSAPDLTIAVNQTLQALGKKLLTEEQIRHFVGNGADVLLARALSGNIAVDPALDEAFRRHARQLFDTCYEQTGHRQSQLYPSVRATLNALQRSDIKMVLLTNKPSQFLPAIMAQHSLADYFVEVIGGDTFIQKKPDPMALNWLLEKYQLKPEQMLMVGDSKHDIQVAKNAGCRSFAVTYGYNHGESIVAFHPDFMANQIAELLTVLPIVSNADADNSSIDNT